MIFISHRLEEVFEICDRITVLRDGRSPASCIAATSTPAQIVQMMVGRHSPDLFQKEARAPPSSRVVLEVRGSAARGRGRDASAIVAPRRQPRGPRRARSSGLAGLVGSGRTELARAIFGADGFDAARS